MKDRKSTQRLVTSLVLVTTLVLVSLKVWQPHQTLIMIGAHTRRLLQHRDDDDAMSLDTPTLATQDNTQCRRVVSPHGSVTDLAWRLLSQGGLCEPAHVCAYNMMTRQCESTASRRLNAILTGQHPVKRALTKTPRYLTGMPVNKTVTTSTTAQDKEDSDLLKEEDEHEDSVDEKESRPFTNTTLVQPYLKPTDWFLNDVEIQTSRGGFPREGLKTYTSGNVVEAFSTGRQTMARMYDDLENTQAGDFIYLSGWGMNDVEMVPPDDTTSLNHVLRRACVRGVEMRFMIWANALDLVNTRKMYTFVNNELATLCEAHGGLAVMIIDNRVSIMKTASHHQKSLSLTIQGALITYVGGIDIMIDRWDTLSHDNVAFRKSNDLQLYFNGWFDGHQRMEGPVGRDVYMNFITRWNDPTALSPNNWFNRHKVARAILNPIRRGWAWTKKNIFKRQNVPDRTIRTYQHGMTYPTIPPHTFQTPSVDVGGQHVQIVRTFECNVDAYEKFAPKGEFTILQSRVKAIEKAQNYIFIQDQYFILVPELLEALQHAMWRLQLLVIVVQTTIAETKPAGYAAYQYDMMIPLLKLFPNKVKIYTMQKDVYVHSKLFMVDDVYLSVGTSNWNMRSMTLDSELTANTVDATLITSPDGIQVTKLGYDYRIAKLAEAGGFDPVDVAGKPLLEAFAMLDDAAVDPNKILGYLDVKKENYYRFYEYAQQLVDADGRCRDENQPTVREQCQDEGWLASQSSLNQALCKCELQQGQETIEVCMNGPTFGTARHLQMARESDEVQVARSLLSLSAWSVGLGAVVIGVLRR